LLPTPSGTLAKKMVTPETLCKPSAFVIIELPEDVLAELASPNMSKT
jgi:hypothetical protein